MDSIVKDLSFVGKTTSKIGLIISGIIAVILLYFSFVFFTKSDDFKKVNSIIKNVKKCNEQNEINNKSNRKYYNCIITVEYIVDNKTYINDIITNSNINYMYYYPNTLDISYNTKNPNEIKIPGLSNKTIGLIFLIIAIIVFGIGYYSNYLAQNSTIVSTTQGISSLASIVGLNKRRY